MSIISSILIGIIASIVASGVIIYFMYKLKPKLEISPQIAFSKNKHGKITYKIKVVNKSKRSAINLTAELHAIRLFTALDSIGKDLTNIPLRHQEIMELAPNGIKNNSDTFNVNFITEKNLEKKWDDKNGILIRFKIMATDAVSNHTKVFTKVYYKKAKYLVHGVFEGNDSMNIEKYDDNLLR